MGLYISASGILTAQRRNDITANNVANLNTAGFRASRAESVETATGGVNLESATRDASPGPIQTTGRPLDAAAPEGDRVPKALLEHLRVHIRRRTLHGIDDVEAGLDEVGDQLQDGTT